MRRFIQTAYFRCLSNGFAEKDIEIDEAYDEFVHHLVSFCKNEQDLILLSLTLSYTKTEFQSLREYTLIQSNIQNSHFLDKGIYMIDSAITIVDLRMSNPKIFEPVSMKSISKSPLHLSNNVAYVDIMELACGLFYADVFQTISGSIVSFADIARVFEVGFNFDFSDIYKKREEVIKRKPSKRTEFLSKLIYFINQESRKQGYL